MPEPIIDVRGISKEYVLTHKLPYVTLRDTVTSLMAKPFQLFHRPERTEREKFLALKNVSFTVQRGEAIGLIGPNGSGKSTMLKILSQIVAPTSGEIRLHGRVASLLEVGTGFHPELTGRENIFLNGAVLGMSRSEITQKFNEIVAFSGVEKFLDTPVKRYSSGMHVRLAFSVAAHLEPEILLVDEVLAVGDAEFQKKCLGKMDEVTRDSGRTVIFVSHNMEAIKKLCTKCILLKDGQAVMFDETKKVVETYLRGGQHAGQQPLHDRHDRETKGRVTMTDIAITTAAGKMNIESGDPLRFRIKYKSIFSEPIRNVRMVIAVVNDSLQNVLWLDSEVSRRSLSVFAPHGEIVCAIEAAHLAAGRYFVHLNFHIAGVSEDLVLMASSFEVKDNLQRYDYQKSPDATAANYLVSFQFSQPR